MTIPIRSGSGNYTYVLGDDFAGRHVAEDLDGAERKARALYDPFHKDRHGVAVTVIVRSSLVATRDGVDIEPQGKYEWALGIDGVQAVMMGPSGRVGADGDPGTIDRDVRSVVLSGYISKQNQNQGVITHIAASQ